MNNNTFVHKYLKPLIKKEDTVVEGKPRDPKTGRYMKAKEDKAK